MIDGKIVYTGFAGCDLLVIQDGKNVGAIRSISFDSVTFAGVLMYGLEGNCSKTGMPPGKEIFSDIFDIEVVCNRESFLSKKLFSVTTLDDPEEYKIIRFHAKSFS